MKQSLILGLAGAALLAACSDGRLPGSWTSSTGGIAPSVTVDASIATGSRALRAPMAVDATDLSLRLVSADGSLDRTWAKVADFDSEEEFAVGDYTLEAFYGSADSEGFDAPYYTGTTSLTVREDQSTPVSVTARLANAMVSIDYTDAFKGYMTAWSATAASDAGKATVEFVKDETRAAYLTPGAVTIKVNVTKPNGLSATLQAASFTAVARHHYSVTIDVNNGEVGDAVLTITIDDSTETETVEIDLSDDIITAPAPEVTTAGFTSGDALTCVEGAKAENPLKLNIVARGGIASVRMTTESASLRQQGWPAEIDLVGADAAMQATLKQLGLNALGLFKNPDKMAVVDLSDVLSHLYITASGAAANSFAFTVTDRYSKTSEPVTLDVNLIKLQLEITGAGSMLYDADNVDLYVGYNGAAFADNVKIQTRNARGGWDDLKINAVTADGENAYLVNVAIARAQADMHFRAVAISGLTSDEVLVPVVEPNVAIEASANNTFATYAYIKASGEDAEGMQFEYSTDGGESYTKAGTAVLAASHSRSEGTYYKVAGLPAGITGLMLRVNDADHASRPVTIDTEAAAQLPENRMDNWTSEKKGDYQYLWKAGAGNPWGTLNELTTSQSGSGSGNGLSTGGCAYKSTSGTIPANGRSTQSAAGGGTFGTQKHSDGHTEGNASLHSDNAHNGSANAALIRSVGWGSGNTAKASGSGFGTCNNLTAGELYLGTYENGAPVYGYAFASRPSEVSFFYRYDVVNSGNGDFGTVEATVYDAEGNVIATSNLKQLTEQSDYTPVSLPLTYVLDAPKAAKISVVFKSSGNPDAMSKSTTYWRCPGAKNVSGGEYVGSELYIDDIELVY